jgi:hypothetical protein
MIERLRAIQALRPLFNDGRSLHERVQQDGELQREISELARHYLGREVRGCSNCYSDALFELLTLNIERAMQKEECKFKLRGGKLLLDAVNGDVSKAMTQANISDELALYHLKTNPYCEEYFEELPANWKEMVEKFDIDTIGKGKSNSEEFDPERYRAIIDEMKEDLKGGMSKNKLMEKFKGVDFEGKNLTSKEVKECLKEASKSL